jgi:hypothetical protein
MGGGYLMQSMWYRSGDIWNFLPVPGVTVAPFRGKWHAWIGNMPLRAVQPSANSEAVKRAVWEYFDRRVEL